MQINKSEAGAIKAEMSSLKEANKRMVEMLTEFTNGVTRMAQGIKTKGQSMSRAEAAKFTDVWGDLADNVNAMFNSLVNQFVDISRLISGIVKRLEAAITAEESQLASVLQNMTEGVIVLDRQGKIIVINLQARRMLDLGLSEEVAPRVLKEKIKALALDKAIEECQKKKRLVTKEIIPREDLLLSCHLSPVKDAEGKIIGTVAILKDITKARESDRLQSEFFSTVSHEIRTPIIGIGGIITNILMGAAGQVSGKIEEYLIMASRNIKRLDRLTTEFLDYSKIKRGALRLKKSDVDICRLARNAISNLNPQIEEKKIKLSTNFSKEKSYYYVDGDKITQVFTNLIHNSIKFTPESGSINVDIKYSDQRKILEVAVVDTGIGIAQEDIPKLFKHFVQIYRKDVVAEKGTGLGLAICKGIVQAHKGVIRVESTLGRGSKFIFTLPQCTAEDFFEDCLNNGLQKAEDNQSVLTLIVIFIGRPYAKEKVASPTESSNILNKLEKLTKETIRRDADLVLKYKENRIAVILEGTNKKDSLMFIERLKKKISEEGFADFKGKPGVIRVIFGVASYPHDAHSVKELVKQADKPCTYRQYGL